MRIVTRADFDGVVCAALLRDAEGITEPTRWVEPSEMQRGKVPIGDTDILANLPFHPRCAMWFDHHYTNRPSTEFKGAFRMAPSAARVIHEYYQGRFSRDWAELVDQADKIDAADLTREEVERPEDHPYILLSMTLTSLSKDDEPYWNRLVELLESRDIGAAMADPEVARRCEAVVGRNAEYRKHLLAHTRLDGPVAVTDFRSFKEAPTGNRFLVYSLFPRAIVHARIRYDKNSPERMIVNVGHSIFNRACRVNVGALLSRYNGGGHAGAGSCTLIGEGADAAALEIIEILKRNEPID